MSTRVSGILLHPTSLPGPFGIGDLGPEAYAFVDRLRAMKQSIWQVLPLTPTSYGDSPYFSPSAFAVNPLLISPERLIEEGWLAAGDLGTPPAADPERVDYAAAVAFKQAMLDTVAERFETRATPQHLEALADFTRDQGAWLADYALFMALKDEQGGRPWIEWPEPLAGRDPAALAEAKARLYRQIRRHELAQFLFFRQWRDLKNHANRNGLVIVGDAPIFVAHDSADVWAHPELWRLDALGHPLVVAGVPPDYFSETGQLWGNPLYDWDRMAELGYGWWADRLKTLLTLVDRVRLDHFRGFAAFWEIPAGEPTAINGRWVPGPGKSFFAALQQQLGDLPLIAEDLGVITPDVVELREAFGLPGMKILQFAFDTSEENKYFPHLFGPNSVVYTGTHDNDTSVGWFRSAKESDRALLAEYVGKSSLEEPHWELIRLGHASVADTAIVPMQDLLGLGTEARMNMPGKLGGNWQWRMRPGELTDAVVQRFRRMTELFDRDLR